MAVCIRKLDEEEYQVNIIKNLLWLPVLLVMVGCGNNMSKMQGVDEIFETEILDNDTKFFTFRLIRRTPPSPGVMSAGRPGDDLTMAYLEARLEANLAENGYCRDGYLELDSSLAISQTFIRGECREAATEADRQRFTQ